MSKPAKSAQQYSHDIKLLKYYLEEAIKENNTLKYRLKHSEREKRAASSKAVQHTVKTYRTDEVAKKMYRLLRDRGVPLSAVFRMADAQYSKEISNQTLMSTITKLRLGVTEQEVLQIVFSMDTSLNGKIDEVEFKEFVHTYGVGDDSAETFRLEEAAIQKFMRFLKERQMTATKLFEQIDSDRSNSIDANEIRMYLKENKGKLNENEIYLVLNHLDPQKKGVIGQQTFEKFVGTSSKKDQMKKVNDEFEREIKKLFDRLKEAEINPIELFEEADTDKMNGVTTSELETAFKKAFPKQSQLQLKKWVSLLNYNNDKIIDKEEFMTAINAIYSQQEVKNLDMAYSKKRSKQSEEKLSKEAVDKLLQQLSEKIEDSGLTKKEVFMNMDKNGDGNINRNELVLGLKGFGLHVAVVSSLLKVFDKDNSDSIDRDEFLKVLGEDVEVSDVELEQEPLKTRTANKKEEKPVRQPSKGKEVKKELPKKESKKPSPSPEPKPPAKKEPTRPLDKTMEKFAKKESKQIPKKTFEEDEVFQNQEQPEAPKKPEKEYLPQEKLVEHLEKLSGLYRKNKEKAIAFFTKFDRKSTGYVAQANFKTVMKQMLGFSESTKEQLVVDSLFQLAQIDEAVNYKLWLEEIAQNYTAVAIVADDALTKKDSKAEPLNKTSLVKRPQSVKKVEQKPQKPEEKKPESPLKRTESRAIEPEKKLAKKQSKAPKVPESKPELEIPAANLLVSMDIPSQRSIGQKKRGDQIAEFLVLIAEQASKPATASLEVAKATILSYIQYDELKLQDFYLQAKKLKDKKTKYSDKGFAPERNSITRNLSKVSFDVASLQWEHTTKLFKNPSMFKNSADPSDIQQGLLGDCYLLSSLSSIAEYPSITERMVEYEDNQAGLYAVWLCIDGDWQLITVDGWLVVRSVDKRIAFSYSPNEELWVSIIEKAYAKAYGSFQHINGGRTYEAIRDLTGAPGKRYDHTNENEEQVPEDQLWKLLVDADKKQYIMTAGTDANRKGSKKEGHGEDVTQMGIALGHAYSILDVRQVRGERLIKLRNPWGKTEWKGDWSDSSAKWTKELRKELDAADADDGIFWMPFSNYYCQEFQVTCINFIRPTYYYRTVRPEKGVLEFMVRCQPFSHGYITLSQRDLRHVGESDNTKYSRVSIATFGMKGQAITHYYTNEHFGGRRDACIELTPTAGQDPCVYVIVEKECQFNLNYYGKEDIKMNASRSEDMIDSLLATMLPEDGYIPQKNFSYFLNNFGRYFFFCIRNNHATRRGTFKVEIGKCNGIEIMEPQKKGSQSFSVEVDPGQTKVVKYRITGTGGYGIESYSTDAALS